MLWRGCVEERGWSPDLFAPPPLWVVQRSRCAGPGADRVVGVSAHSSEQFEEDAPDQKDPLNVSNVLLAAVGRLVRDPCSVRLRARSLLPTTPRDALSERGRQQDNRRRMEASSECNISETDARHLVAKTHPCRVAKCEWPGSERGARTRITAAGVIDRKCCPQQSCRIATSIALTR